MKHLVWLLAALTLLSGCGSAIDPSQADGTDCNSSLTANACASPTSYCDPGEPGLKGDFLRKRTYGLTGDKTHVVGTCRPKGAAGAPCLGKEQCLSDQCEHPGAAPAIGSKGVCK